MKELDNYEWQEGYADLDHFCYINEKGEIITATLEREDIIHVSFIGKKQKRKRWQAQVYELDGKVMARLYRKRWVSVKKEKE